MRGFVADMEPIELVVLVGIQASGKTTYYSQAMQDRYVHVSLDNWRGKGNVRAKEYQAILTALGRSAASGGAIRGVVVDNTSVTAATRRRYFDIAEEFALSAGCPVRMIAYHFDADLESCLERNRQRPKDAPAGVPYFVPPEVIAGYQQRLQPPTPAEGFDKVFRVRIAADGCFVVEEVAP